MSSAPGSLARCTLPCRKCWCVECISQLACSLSRLQTTQGQVTEVTRAVKLLKVGATKKVGSMTTPGECLLTHWINLGQG